MPGNPAAGQKHRSHRPGWFQRTISLDLTISLVLLVIITSTMVTVFTYLIVSKAERERLDSHADDYVQYLLQSLELPMWTLDNRTVRKIAEAYFSNQQIAGIEINEILNDNGSIATKKVISLQKVENRPLFQKTADITHNDQVIGRVTISFSNRLFQESLQRFLWSWVITVVLVVMILILMVQALLRWIVQRPMEHLLVGIESISRGNYDYAFEKAPQKEIRTVAESFTNMAKRIQARENSLASVNRQLQDEIRERKRGETAVRRSEALLRATLDSTADGILVVDAQGSVLTANDRFMQMWRVPDSLISDSRDAGLLEFVHEQLKDPVGFREKVAALYESDEVSIDEVEFRDGRVFERYSRPFILEGRHIGRVWNFRDITDKKKAEEERSLLQEKLARSQKMEALGLLAGGVAHDLNNILSGIVSYPELLLMKGGLDAKTTRALQTILDSGHRAAEVVNDLTTISKGIASTREVLNINRIIREYLKSVEYQNLISMHDGVRLNTRLDPELMNISGSAIHIRKAVMNLVTNACEAIHGSGRIIVATRNQYLDKPLGGDSILEAGEYTVLSVSDTGPGISRSDLERIFEPFYTKKVMGRSGTGLGLTVVWNTVKDHGGYVDVTSNADGTRFDLYFPSTPQDLHKSEETRPINDFQGNNEKILVIDDEKSQREIAVQILSFLGYSVDAVSSGDDAIEYVKQNPVDLIVLDMIMPSGISGRQTYEVLSGVRPGIKTVIASGFSVTEDVKAIQQQGAGRFIKKPYTTKRLGRAVKAEISKTRQKFS